MTNIERYLSDALPYDALTDAERCAICAAMEGMWPAWLSSGDVDQYVLRCHNPRTTLSGWTCVPYYFSDGTAALRLVERFKLTVWHNPHMLAIPYACTLPGKTSHMYSASTAMSIVACVCEIAKAEWPYKEAR